MITLKQKNELDKGRKKSWKSPRHYLSSKIPPKMSLLETEKAYIAGIIDGEGCIHIRKIKNHYGLLVQVAITNREIVDYLIAKVGGSMNIRQAKQAKWKDVYTWRVTDITAEVLLKKIKLYLIIKKLQCELALSFRKTFYGEVESREKILLIRQKYRLQLKELKK